MTLTIARASERVASRIFMTVPLAPSSHYVTRLPCRNLVVQILGEQPIISSEGETSSAESSQLKGEVSSFSCNLLALDHEQRHRHSILTQELVSKTLEIKELPDGYGLRFPHDRMLFAALSEWATLEQLCCPFLTLTLELQRDQGPVWLKASGNDGVKDFLRTELGI